MEKDNNKHLCDDIRIEGKQDTILEVRRIVIAEDLGDIKEGYCTVFFGSSNVLNPHFIRIVKLEAFEKKDMEEYVAKEFPHLNVMILKDKKNNRGLLIYDRVESYDETTEREEGSSILQSLYNNKKG